MADRLRAAAERALDALNDLIRNTFDPGSEALGARYELAHALTAPAARQTTGQATAVPCNWAHSRVGHEPHNWEPQPGVQPVHCPGYSESAAEHVHKLGNADEDGGLLDDWDNCRDPECPGPTAAEMARARMTTGQGGTELGSRPTAPVTLATPCDNCDHVLNWHGNQAACVFAFCGCGRFRAPEPAAGQQAEARTTDEARPPREQWRVEIYDPVAEEWAPGVAFSERDRAAERLDTVPTYSPRWGTDTPPRRRLVRETTTWTVENEDR
ncbi:hypothetical protein [Streptomyces sp. NPDC001919]